MVQVLRRVFTGKHETHSSDTNHNTSLLMVEFQRLTDWKYDETSREVQHSKTLFTHLMTSLAAELVFLIHGPEDKRMKGILVVSFLKGFLSQFEKFCEELLTKACIEYMRMSGLGSNDEKTRKLFAFSELKSNGYLDFAAAEKSGGRDCHVCFAVFPQRQKGDLSWTGTATQRHLQFIALSRASGKCFIYIETLSDGMVLPENEKPLSLF